MSDQEWANGPSAGAVDPAPQDGSGWERGDANGRGRSASPARGGGRDRSRSPMRGVDRGRPSGGDGANNPGSNCHVSGISARCEDEDLRQLFSKYGTITKCQVMKDPHTQENRGFAFVNFDSPDAAEAAIDAVNGTDFQGKVITVQKARRGRARTPTPGQYHGPPKERGFPPPRYDDRYGRGGGYGSSSRYDDRDYRRDDRDRYGSSRYDDYGRGGSRYDDYYDRRAPPRDDYDRRPPPRDYDDRRRY